MRSTQAGRAVKQQRHPANREQYAYEWINCQREQPTHQSGKSTQ
jgi:hypothetical protein